jgi:uncharacterized protein
MPGPDEYDHHSKESDMHVLEVRNDELMDSLHRAELGTSFARAYVIPSEYHVAVQDNEAIAFAAAPDSPADRGRLNDTRVALP